jgi:uncharacterized oxidoreductase
MNRRTQMKLTKNTILITGATSGIGLQLAQELKKLENTVLVAGRSKTKLAEAEKRGFKTFQVDMSSPESISQLAHDVLGLYPELNVLILNAGVSKPENLLSEEDHSQVQDEMVATNFLGPMRLASALLGHLKKKDAGAIITVSSALAFVPLAAYPTYCATKAALHSYTQSLRYQLKDTQVEVIEIAPPYVQTHLGGERQATDPNAMPVDEFVSELLSLMKEKPLEEEVIVKRAQMLSEARFQGREVYAGVFKQMNGM